MSRNDKDLIKIAVIGLGYVGLPLAVALAKKFSVVGIDVDVGRIDGLRGGVDRTGEIEPEALAESSLELASDPEAARGADIYIVTVPTPVDASNKPDLRAVEAATRTVAGLVDPAKCPIIIIKARFIRRSEVFARFADAAGLVPGATSAGYSPERINPGQGPHGRQITGHRRGRTCGLRDLAPL